MKKAFQYFYCIICCWIASFQSILAQDVHYSQFFNAPILTNPALTGKFNQDFRAGIHYRNQWNSIQTPFISYHGFFDFNLVKLPYKIDKLGIGLLFMNDEMTSDLKNQHVLLTSAVHKYLDPYKRHLISFGVQTGMVRKAFNPNGLNFENQIDRTSYTINPSLSSGEQILSEPILSASSGLGTHWEYIISPKFKSQVGYSMFNFIRQRENPYMIDHGNRRSVRQTATFKFSAQVLPRISIQPHILFTWQAGAWENLVGGSIGYKVYPGNINPNSIGHFGAWYRLNDAVIYYVGLRHQSFEFNFSYDATVSSLDQVRDIPMFTRKTVGAYEFSIIWHGFFKRIIPNEYTVPCKFF
jgi:type IX secretion system PorP/SprF family membrane protein